MALKPCDCEYRDDSGQKEGWGREAVAYQLQVSLE